MMPAARRCSDGACPCCGKTALTIETTLVSPFVAHRAWRGRPELTRIALCSRCGFRFFDRGLSPDEATRYYRDYRDGAYLADRRHFEPFYTQRVHNGIAVWLASSERRVALRQALDSAGAPAGFDAALDHGGGDGSLLADIDAARKAVFDPSGSPTIAGVESIADEASIAGEWQLVISCQVFEHLDSPAAALQTIGRALTPEGWLYVEVPDEIWRNHSAHGRMRDAWLNWLIDKPVLLKAADVLSTACRIKLGVLPPFGFVPMREHLNYFTREALDALLRRNGFDVVRSGVNGTQQIFAIARRRTAQNTCRPAPADRGPAPQTVQSINRQAQASATGTPS